MLIVDKNTQKRRWPISLFMRTALIEAQKAIVLDEIPVGAVISRKNHIIAAAHNMIHTVVPDPTGHAEILAIRAACQILQSERLADCDLYVTLEPCTMCAAAISFARIRRLYYGAQNLKGGAVENGARFFSQPTCHHSPDVYSAIAESDCTTLLRDFFLEKRKKVSSNDKTHCYLDFTSNGQ
ncbi:MAG: hypothetical protein JSC085_000026 [Candidatus Tokpelaia sp. JSC085]|nr:MAG: hypothetical protein JSC085_000026 [Candidatus Tokpelaia sp. JSC085]